MHSKFILLQMSISLAAIGYWMYLDVAATPDAVVACVMIFNAAFGFRSVCNDMSIHASPLKESKAGDPFHGFTHQKYDHPSFNDYFDLIRSTDYASYFPSQRSFTVHSDELGFQYPRRRNHSVSSRKNRVEVVFYAFHLLCS